MVLAVDAGGSGTRAVVVEPDGTCRGYGTGPAGNPTSAGPDDAVRAVAGAARGALLQAQRSVAAVGTVLVAMAGSRHLTPPRLLADALGLPEGDGQVRVVSDVLAMYHSGAVEPAGCAVIAGTGSVAARVEEGELVRVFGGSGWLLGDGGSGFAIGRRVVRAVVAELDGLAPTTALTDLLLADLGIVRDESLVRGRSGALDQLITRLYEERPVALARFAPLAFAVPEDVVAAAVVERAQDEVAGLVRAGRGRSTAPLVLGGSVMLRGLLAPGRSVSPALEEALAGADVRHVRDGVVGAAVAGLRQAGHPLDPAVLGRVRSSMAEVRAAPRDPRSGAGEVR